MSKEAMKLALEEMKIGNYNSAAERLEAALAEQPAQHEPVAWCVINNGELIEATFYRDYAEEILAGQIEGCGSEIAPLYTSPPAQRTWVGLTLEDMETTHWSPDFRAGAKWAAAKLKEKNT